MDETYCSFNTHGKLVVPMDKLPVVSEDHRVGHISCLCTINAAGESLKPFLILPLLRHLPLELIAFLSQCVFCSSLSRRIISKIFYIWCFFYWGGK